MSTHIYNERIKAEYVPSYIYFWKRSLHIH